MVLEFHLHIETSEFTEMSVGVRVLSTEDWTNLENSLQITTKSHLFVELRTLGKASISLEVLELKHVGTTLRCSTNQFW